MPSASFASLEPVVAADEGEDERSVLLHDRHRLRGRRRVDAEELGQPFDGRHAWRLHLDGARSSVLGQLGGARNAARDLEVGGVVAPFSHVTSVFSPEPEGARKSMLNLLPPSSRYSASTA